MTNKLLEHEKGISDNSIVLKSTKVNQCTGTNQIYMVLKGTKVNICNRISQIRKQRLLHLKSSQPLQLQWP